MVTHCYIYDVTPLSDPALFEDGLARLPWGERRAKVERFVFARDRRLCLGAGLLAAYALRKAGANSLALAYGEHDKPSLRDCSHIHFNLSHSGTLVACAVSNASVGVDVQKRHANDEGIARLCYTNEERAWISAQTDQDWAFTRLWTRKESYLKLLGTGLSKPADSFEALPGSAPEPDVRFFEHVQDDHALCVCTRVPGEVEFVVVRAL